jgi:uncharacterized protein (DUF433 family)
MTQYITSNPQIMSGQPCVAGTRILIARMLFLLKEGYTLQEIQQHYPHVPLEKFEGVLSELAQAVERTTYDAQVL